MIDNLSAIDFSEKYKIHYRTVIRNISKGQDDQLIVTALERSLFPKTREMRSDEKIFYFYCWYYKVLLIQSFDNPKRRKQIKKDYYTNYHKYGLELTATVLDNGWERNIINQVYL